MTSITYVGMDVHTTNYTLCAYNNEEQRPFAEITINPDIKELTRYLDNLEKKTNGSKIICGYEAGCLGYTLYHQLKAKGRECIILAPTKIPSLRNEIKTDKRDARKLAQAMANNTYRAVYVPNEEDNAVKEYIRMRDDAQNLLKQTKQQIIALCTRHGYIYQGRSYWTQKHLTWLRAIKLSEDLMQETLSEYLITYDQLNDKVERFEKRIEEIAQRKEYCEKVKRLVCFKGIKTHTAMSLIVETGDFSRFPTAQHFSAFLGLVPGEHSSSDNRNRLSITKAGNSHLRRLLTESANSYSRTYVCKKSINLKQRQQGNPPEVIAYADRANDRLRRKYMRITTRSKANIAKIAVARELACFIWGMMNDRII